MDIYLQTDRMILRELELSDEENIFNLDSDPEVMKYISNGMASSREDVRSALIRTHDLYLKHQRRFGFWAAIEKSSHQFMGWFHFRPAKMDPENIKRIELGYRFKKIYWGKNFATEGSRALIAKGFSQLGVEEVFAVTMKANLGSQGVMKKSGLLFSREFYDKEFPGTQDLDVEYVISRKDWKYTASMSDSL